MITIWVDGQDHEIHPDQVIPWIFGIQGVLDTADLGLATVDVDQATYDQSYVMYIIEIDGVRHELAESWVLPWMHGLAVRNGIDREICDPSAAERAQRVQALMVGHQLGLFTYTGFTRRKEAT